MDAEEASTIGARARMIRRRRGLSQDVVAGLAEISKPYLSQLERGQRGFNRRGLLEDLAEACMVGTATARHLGRPELAIQTARRGYEAACRVGDPALTAQLAVQRAL